MKQTIHKKSSNAQPTMRKNSNSDLKPPINFQRIGSMFEKWNKENLWEQNSAKDKALIFMRRNIKFHKQNIIRTNSMICDSYPEIFNNSRKSRILLNSSGVKSSKWNIAESIENNLVESFNVMNKRLQQTGLLRSNSLQKNFNKSMAGLELKSIISSKSNENSKKKKQVRFADTSEEVPLIQPIKLVKKQKPKEKMKINRRNIEKAKSSWAWTIF